MTYSECVGDDEYYVCPSEYGDLAKTSCCVDSNGRGQCCVPETVGTREELWTGYETESPMLYYMDYLLIFGASIVLLVIMGLLCCEYAEFNIDEDNSYLIKQHSLAPEIKLSKPHEYNGNNFKVIREYNRHIGTVPSAPPSYYEEFDNISHEDYSKQNYPVYSTENTPHGSKLNSSFNQHLFAEPTVQYQFESPSCSNSYQPPSNAPRSSPSFFKWT